MIWLTYRQHRQQALFATGAMALISLFLVLTGLHMSSVFHNSGLAHCLSTRSHNDCGDLESSFESRFGTLRQLVPFFMVLPLLAGLFWGAPLVARELEHGTHRLVWTQGVSRLRWLSTKLVALLALTVALGAAYAALITWWLTPLNHSTGDRFQAGIFDQQGIVPVAYALFALALGIAAGTVFGKTMTGMAATLVGFVGLRLIIAGLVRRHFLTPVKSTYAPLPGIDTNHPGAWVFSQRTVDGSGHTIPQFTVGSVCRASKSSTPTSLDHCVRAHGFLNIDVFQPASRFWLFQGIEGGIYVALAVVLIAVTVVWIRKRVV
jgi:ABC-type transport system involved in multi-copper enzyme maturation permease subunit